MSAKMPFLRMRGENMAKNHLKCCHMAKIFVEVTSPMKKYNYGFGKSWKTRILFSYFVATLVKSVVRSRKDDASRGGFSGSG